MESGPDRRDEGPEDEGEGTEKEGGLQGGRFRTPDDLRHHVLLHDDSLRFEHAAPDWPMWLKAAGVREVDTSRGPHFSHPDHAMQAAMDGAGVVLGWRTLASADLAAGRLVIPFDITLAMELSFFFVCPQVATDRPKIVAFRDWLLDETGRSHAA